MIKIVKHTFSNNKFLILLALCLFGLLAYKNEELEDSEGKHSIAHKLLSNVIHKDEHDRIIEEYYKKRQSWKTSNLGSILFKNIKAEVFRNKSKENRTFVVLIWKYWDWLKNRHVHNFNNLRKRLLEGCSVQNCKFTGNDDHLENSDAVVVHLQHGKIPNAKLRNSQQRWIFLTDEAATNTFSLAPVKPKLSNLANVFNWSMTFRSDADIPVPYGRTVPVDLSALTKNNILTLDDLIPYWNRKRRNVLVAVLMSNCGVSFRMNYLKELRKYISVDVYGKCSDGAKNSCPGHFKSDCKVMSEYLFYLVLENSMCRQYLTEKSFFHAYSKGSIPVIMGPPIEDCDKLLPPNSFLHIDDYDSPKELAKEIENISENHNRLIAFHTWRSDFQVVNEHGYFGSKSFHYCRICEALNYNDEKSSIYSEDDLRLFLDPDITCNKI